MNKSIRIWVEGTIIAALAMVLSLIPLDIGASFSISLGQIPLTIFALRRGWKPGLAAGAIWGLLHFPMGKVWYLSVIQVLIEYPIAFTFAGLAGLYAVKLKREISKGDGNKIKLTLIQGAFAGALARYFWHFVAGWVFWGSYAQWGMKPWLYSLVMNSASGLATAVTTAVVVVLSYTLAPQLFTPKATNSLSSN